MVSLNLQLVSHHVRRRPEPVVALGNQAVISDQMHISRRTVTCVLFCTLNRAQTLNYVELFCSHSSSCALYMDARPI